MVKPLAEHLRQADPYATMVTAMRTDQIVADHPCSHDETIPGLHPTSPKTPHIVAVDAIDAIDACLTSVAPLPKLDNNTNAGSPELKSGGIGCSRKKCKPVPSKLDLAHPRLLIQMICLAYLATVCTIFNIGGQAMRGYLQPRIHMANAQIEAAKSLANQENVLYTQLEGVLSRPLPGRFMESYEECLARGLTSANEQFLGIDFTRYPEVRIQTMDWATENCNRLFHAPRVVNSSPEEITITYWVKATYKARQLAMEALTRFRRKASFIRTWLAGDKQMQVAVESKAGSNSSYDSSQHFDMPFGFEALCHAPSPCKLVYRNVSSSNPAKMNPENTTAEAERTVATFSYLDKLARFYMIFNLASIASVSFVEMIAGLVYLVMACFVLMRPLPCFVASKASLGSLKSFSELGDDRSYVCVCLLIQGAVSMARLKLEGFLTSGSRFLLPFSLVSFVVAAIQLVNFFLVDAEVEYFESMVRSGIDLCLIMLGRDLDLHTRDVPSPDGIASNDNRSYPHGNASTVFNKPEATSKVAARFVSPMTTIHEDIQAELKAIRAQHGEPWRSRFEINSNSDSDSDSDTDDEIFVELGWYSPSKVADRQGDWSFIDA